MKKIITLLTLTLLLAGCAPQEAENPAFLGKKTLEKSDQKQVESVNLNKAENIQPSTEKVFKAPQEAEAEQLPEQISVLMKTTLGNMEIKLYPQKAPLTVVNFLNLLKADFYDGIKFHRVIPDFMIQTGDPKSKDDNWLDDGTGGPGYQFKDETSPEDKIVYGSVAMANSGPNTNGSQFFIVTKQEGCPWLNGRHTIFGQVIKGMDIAEKISQVERNERDHPLEDVIIQDIQIIN